jgi:Translation initiation factor IF-2, N-terminal region
MPPKKKVRIVNHLTVYELAKVLGLTDTVVIKALYAKGIMRTINMIVELETARKLAIDMGYQLTDEDDPPDEHAATVTREPKIPQGGNEVALPEPKPDSEED